MGTDWSGTGFDLVLARKRQIPVRFMQSLQQSPLILCLTQGSTISIPVWYRTFIMQMPISLNSKPVIYMSVTGSAYLGL